MESVVYNFPSHKSGRTFKGVAFELKVNSVGKSLVGAVINFNIAGKIFSNTTNEIVITDASAGKFQFAKQKVILPPNIYQYDITIIFADGDEKTYISGIWTIT
jgi:hypothetical protein